MFRIGEAVFGREGKLGEISRVVVDPDSHDVTYVVVKHGTLRASERLLPVAALESQDGEAYTDISTPEFEQLQLFDLSQYHGPDPDYTALRASMPPRPAARTPSSTPTSRSGR
ncbi:MAG: PRC-barrel domain-containing protein [Thermoflexaceae bacterium]|nr:PRC-barrel domain-containing protein [Thermoflexaceae bacterium]